MHLNSTLGIAMNRLWEILIWLWRLWPAICVFILLLVHVTLIYYFPISKSDIHKTIALFSQITGGVIILYSIDSNFGIIKNLNLLGVFKNYMSDFPLIKHTLDNKMKATSHISAGCDAIITLDRHPQTIEERLEYLQEQITEIKQEFYTQTNKLSVRIDTVKNGLKKDIQESNSELDRVKRQVEVVSIGGLKTQVLGVLLVLYGSVAGYVA